MIEANFHSFVIVKFELPTKRFLPFNFFESKFGVMLPNKTKVVKIIILKYSLNKILNFFFLYKFNLF